MGKMPEAQNFLIPPRRYEIKQKDWHQSNLDYKSGNSAWNNFYIM